MSLRTPTLGLACAVLLGFMLTLSVYPPVSWLAARVDAATGGRLAIAGVQGSLWLGSCQVLLFDGEARRAIPGRLSWRVQVGGLWNAQTALLRIEHPNLQMPLDLQRTPDGMAINASQLQFPANWLEASGAPWNTIRPAGNIVINWQSIRFGDAFSVKILWQDAQSALSVVKPLGNYEVAATISAEGLLDADLRTLSGDLNIEGKARWSAAEGFGFRGYASASPSQEAALTGLLSQMGRLENNRYRLGS
jgi:general secretion pathway protein N